MLVDDGGAADLHHGVGIAAAGIDTVPEDGGCRLGAVRGGGIVGGVFARRSDLAQNGAGREVAGGEDDGAAAIVAQRFPVEEATRATPEERWVERVSRRERRSEIECPVN